MSMPKEERADYDSLVYHWDDVYDFGRDGAAFTAVRKGSTSPAGRLSAASPRELRHLVHDDFDRWHGASERMSV
jgi:hypothetical protein